MASILDIPGDALGEVLKKLSLKECLILRCLSRQLGAVVKEHLAFRRALSITDLTGHQAPLDSAGLTGLLQSVAATYTHVETICLPVSLNALALPAPLCQHLDAFLLGLTSLRSLTLLIDEPQNSPKFSMHAHASRSLRSRCEGPPPLALPRPAGAANSCVGPHGLLAQMVTCVAASSSPLAHLALGGLKTINMSDLTAALHAIAHSGKQVESLDLMRLGGLTPQAIFALSGEPQSSERAGSAHPHGARFVGRLQRLSLIECCRVDEASLAYMFQRAASLEDVTLLPVDCHGQGADAPEAAHAVQVGFKALLALSSGASKLRKLHISEELAPSVGLDDAGLFPIATACSELRVLQLNLVGVTDRFVVALARGCRHLEHLELVCSEVSDDGVRAVVRGCAALEALVLRSSLVRGARTITDAGIKAIAQHARSLCVLQLDALCGVTAAGLSSLLEHQQPCVASRLTALALDHLPDLFSRNGAGSDAALLATLLARATSLERLSLQEYRGPIEAAITGLLASSRRLREVDISCCKGDLAAVMRALVDHAPSLHHLALAECKLKSTELLHDMLKRHGKSLKTLDVWGVPGLSVATAELIVQECAALERLNMGGPSYCHTWCGAGEAQTKFYGALCSRMRCRPHTQLAFVSPSQLLPRCSMLGPHFERAVLPARMLHGAEAA